jgi:hypothetical protein
MKKVNEKYEKERERERCSLKRTNLSNKSLISADRTNKGTLPLTILRCIFKSSAKDFTFPIFGARRPANLSAYWPDLTKYDSGHKIYSYSIKYGKIKSSLPAWILTWGCSAIIQHMVASRHCLLRQPQIPIM